MKKYSSSSDTTGLLGDYVSYMSKYVDMMSKLEAIDAGELSSEELIYYTETMGRITQKLLEAAG